LPDAACTFTVTVVCGSVTSPVTTAVSQPQQIIPTNFSVTARPNPSASYFTLNIKSANQHTVSLRITDVLGRVIEARSDLAANSSLDLGHQYLPGVYFVQVVQDKSIITLKLIKR
jgi:hypothetical protein